MTVSGTETFAGSTASAASHPVIPLKASGVFAGRGHITLGGGGNGGTGSIRLGDGVLAVRHSKGKRAQRFSAVSCRVTGSVTGTYVVTGGTGAYKSAAGHGEYKVSFAATARKNRNGKCATGAAPVPGSSLTMFTARGPLTIKTK